MVSELRWPGDPDPDTGIDVHTLELDAGDLALFDIVRRPDVMAYLAEWNAGSALGDGMRDQVLASSALAVITVTGERLSDYASGGSAVEAVYPRPARRPRCPGVVTGLFAMLEVLPISMSYRLGLPAN